MPESSDLLFLLSSADRRKLLFEIREGDYRLTQLAEKLAASVQETSKHLGRLVEAELIEKTTSGCYRLTTFGRLALDLLPSFDLISKRKDYYLSHELSFLPREFVLRIGDLSDHVFVEHVSNVLAECEHLLGMAEQFFYWIVDQPMPWLNQRAPLKKMSLRGILPFKVTTSQYEQARKILGRDAEIRFFEDVRIGIALNEQMGAVAFPDLKGRTDFSSGLLGYSPVFRKWCYDLFTCYWNKSRATRPTQSQTNGDDSHAYEGTDQVAISTFK